MITYIDNSFFPLNSELRRVKLLELSKFDSELKYQVSVVTTRKKTIDFLQKAEVLLPNTTKLKHIFAELVTYSFNTAKLNSKEYDLTHQLNVEYLVEELFINKTTSDLLVGFEESKVNFCVISLNLLFQLYHSQYYLSAYKWNTDLMEKIITSLDI